MTRSSGKHPSSGDIVSGLGVGLRFFQLLIESISEAGGDPGVIRLMTTPRFEVTLKQVARFIALQDWWFPASEMRALAPKYCGFDISTEVRREIAQNLCWWGACRALRIPYESYSGDVGWGLPVMPPDLLRELDGRRMEYPLLVREGQYVVVDLKMQQGLPPVHGEIIHAEKVVGLSIAWSYHFNFEA